MIGNNFMSLNEATMITALQYYFDNVLFKEGKSPKICSVEAKAKTYSVNDFEIKTAEKE